VRRQVDDMDRVPQLRVLVVRPVRPIREAPAAAARRRLKEACGVGVLRPPETEEYLLTDEAAFQR
jgi:hypothetical protein